MKYSLRILSIFAFVCMIASSAAAQNEKYNWEGFAGYSYLNRDTGLDEDVEFPESLKTVSMHGFNGSITGNVHKWVGLKFDFSTHCGSESAVITEDEDEFQLDLKLRTTQYLGGIQIKNNLKDGPRFKPFAHVLAGVANQKTTATITPTAGGSTVFSDSFTDNAFAMVFGGGVDVKVHERVDIRVFQFDYNPVFFKGNESFELPSSTQNNWRISFGVVIH